MRRTLMLEQQKRGCKPEFVDGRWKVHRFAWHDRSPVVQCPECGGAFVGKRGRNELVERAISIEEVDLKNMFPFTPTFAPPTSNE